MVQTDKFFESLRTTTHVDLSDKSVQFRNMFKTTTPDNAARHYGCYCWSVENKLIIGNHYRFSKYMQEEFESREQNSKYAAGNLITIMDSVPEWEITNPGWKKLREDIHAFMMQAKEFYPIYAPNSTFPTEAVLDRLNNSKRLPGVDFCYADGRVYPLFTNTNFWRKEHVITLLNKIKGFVILPHIIELLAPQFTEDRTINAMSVTDSQEADRLRRDIYRGFHAFTGLSCEVAYFSLNVTTIWKNPDNLTDICSVGHPCGAVVTLVEDAERQDQLNKLYLASVVRYRTFLEKLGETIPDTLDPDEDL